MTWITQNRDGIGELEFGNDPESRVGKLAALSRVLASWQVGSLPT